MTTKLPPIPWKPKTAMVLAAGLGKRLRPLTDDRPKALVEVARQSLIDRSLDHLAAFAIQTVVVNVHHQAAALEAHLAARPTAPPTVISDERQRLLDTGGGVHKALPHLGPEPFFVLNCDALWVDGAKGALPSLAEAFDPARMDALLLLVERQSAHYFDGAGDFEMGGDGRLARRDRETAPYVFAGLQILDPALFKAFEAAPYSLNLVYDRALAAGRLYGCVFDGDWYHVGTPEAVDRTTQILER